MFTRETVVNETHIRKSTNVSKSTVGLDASQLYLYSISQPMPTGVYARNESDADLQKFMPIQNKFRSFGKMVTSYFQRKRLHCKIELFYIAATEKKIDCLNTIGFCGHCITVLESKNCSYRHCPSEEVRPALTEENNQHGPKKQGNG